MNSYIVRIYREEENNPRNFVGTVEVVSASGKRAFTSLDELWAILNPAEKEKAEKINEANHNIKSNVRLSRGR